MTAPRPLDNAGIARLIERRRKVRLWWSKDTTADDAAWNPADGDAPVGLALSGGGIRSATFSLGLIQALAKSQRDALGKIDVLSTVSGGGYVGCFLRSLFVPGSLRGIVGTPDEPGLDREIAGQYRFARRALASDPSERDMALRPGVPGDKARLRNPMWWLREHSRYLAPSGMTDFSFAIAYIARNWLAMVYLIALACVAVGAALVSAEAGLMTLARWPELGHVGRIPLSPLFMVTIVPVAASAMLMIAYWATQAMSSNEPNVSTQRSNLLLAIALIAAAALATMILLTIVLVLAPEPPGEPDPTKGMGRWFLTAVAMAAVISVFGALISWAIARALQPRGALLTTELRRILTKALASSNKAFALILLVATIDSMGAWLDWFIHEKRSVGGFGAVLLPALAFLIKKLPDWFGGGSGRGNPGGGIGGLLRRFATTVALVVGLVLYGMIAVGALALVHHVMWTGEAWASPPEWWRMLVLAGIVWVLTIVLGRSTGFINLSSLHSLYSSRLTRAYLGASNVDRLRDIVADDRAAPITENHECDYIQPRVYGQTDLPAPIHVINVTLNETIDPRSQLVSRDRKGDILSVEPDGVRISNTLVRWDALRKDDARKQKGAENISLGQWIAISGAAASAGMGRMTSLGFALAFTFANVRLGYWWWSPHLCPDMPVAKGLGGWIARHFGTFVYLLNEMTCRYSRGYFRKYLTDGGHYENSGAYVLIRRRVKLIVVTDNGADPDYSFADLETLVRQVRIDLGGETTILGGTDRDAVLATLGATSDTIFVEPGAVKDKDPDWRKRMTDATDPAYVLVLRVLVGGETLNILWIKPRLLPGVPADIAGYQLAMKAFPQQPTGDQFFDEAQWESYRRLGELSMARLLDTCPRLLA